MIHDLIIVAIFLTFGAAGLFSLAVIHRYDLMDLSLYWRHRCKREVLEAKRRVLARIVSTEMGRMVSQGHAWRQPKERELIRPVVSLGAVLANRVERV